MWVLAIHGGTLYMAKYGRCDYISLLSLHNKVSLTGGLKQQIFTFSQFWRLEVQGQGPAGLFLVKALFLAFRCPHITFPLRTQRERDGERERERERK